jgi:hypothetical protein
VVPLTKEPVAGSYIDHLICARAEVAISIKPQSATIRRIVRRKTAIIDAERARGWREGTVITFAGNVGVITAKANAQRFQQRVSSRVVSAHLTQAPEKLGRVDSWKG